MIRFSHGVATSVGRVRRVNEDSYLAVPPIYAVADGMGGHGSGDVASRLAVEALARCVELRPLFTEAVLHALEEANQVIVSRAEPPSRMGTTVTGLAGLETAGGDHLMVFNVGDSRVYRLAADRIVQLTVDHSEVQELVLAGVLTREQARTHPRRNVVTRALGAAPTVHSDHWLLPAVGGDRFLICSDGLYRGTAGRGDPAAARGRRPPAGGRGPGGGGQRRGRPRQHHRDRGGHRPRRRPGRRDGAAARAAGGQTRTAGRARRVGRTGRAGPAGRRPRGQSPSGRCRRKTSACWAWGWSAPTPTDFGRGDR